MDYPLGTAITLRETFTVDGVPTDPTGIVFHVLWPDGTEHTYVFGADPVANPSTGVYEFPADPADYTQLGTYIYWAVGTGAVEATSKPRSFTITSVLDGDGETGPCETWVTAEEVEECCAASESSSDFQMAAEAASQALFALVPRFSGTCGPTRVRPCASPCSSSPWGGYAWSGIEWLVSASWGPGGLIANPEPLPVSRGCGCRPLSRVLLSGRVRDVLEVTVDGAVVDPATYRLDEKRWLTRIPDPADLGTRLFWPSCQDMEQAETEDGTFSVLYTYGVAPPLPAKYAAKELACAIFQTCQSEGGANSDDCPLPNNVTRIQRQGITLDLKAFTGWGFDKTRGQWQTGMPLVDLFLNAYNPTGRRKRRSLVWSPDMDRAAQKLGT